MRMMTRVVVMPRNHIALSQEYLYTKIVMYLVMFG